MAKELGIVHHAERRRDVVMPYAPAIVVRRGRLVFLSGVTAAPVYHSHPHREEEFDLPQAMREQAVLAMDNLERTLEAAGCRLADLVSVTRYLTDVREQDDLNRVWAEYMGSHLPATTTVEVSRLATHARCKIEIAAIAVCDDADTPSPPASRRRGARVADPGRRGRTRQASRDRKPRRRG
jgi:2-iminobutanoate/2-iminopropanoate deaminase